MKEKCKEKRTAGQRADGEALYCSSPSGQVALTLVITGKFYPRNSDLKGHTHSVPTIF